MVVSAVLQTNCETADSIVECSVKSSLNMNIRNTKQENTYEFT